MKICSLRRTLPACAPIPLIFVMLCSGCHHQTATSEEITTPRNIILGDFTIMPLPDWREATLTNADVQSVTFTNRKGLRGVEGLRIDVKLYPSTNTTTPQQALQQDVKKERDLIGPSKKGTAITWKHLSSKSTKLNGMIALDDRYVLSTPSDNTYHRTIKFINNGHYYDVLSDTNIQINHVSLLPSLQTKMDQALATVTQQLVPKK